MKLTLLLLPLAVSACRPAESPEAPRPEETGTIGTTHLQYEFPSGFLGAKIQVPTGVFEPGEAERLCLRFMMDHPELFAGKEVMEIGTGTGIISLYAAKLGAKRVVSTDINELAIAAVTANAKSLGFESTVEPRLVPLSDMSAFSVIRENETFDTIISNPPYSLDLDSDTNNAVTDKGDLGFSIIRGLPQHLRPDGVAALFYYSIFYHDVMVKFARLEGFQVRNHLPDNFTPWEVETLFNSYLARLLVREGMDPGAIRFQRNEDPSTLLRLDLKSRKIQPLFPNKPATEYPGWMVIAHAR